MNAKQEHAKKIMIKDIFDLYDFLSSNNKNIISLYYDTDKKIIITDKILKKELKQTIKNHLEKIEKIYYQKFLKIKEKKQNGKIIKCKK